MPVASGAGAGGFALANPGANPAGANPTAANPKPVKKNAKAKKKANAKAKGGKNDKKKGATANDSLAHHAQGLMAWLNAGTNNQTNDSSSSGSSSSSSSNNPNSSSSANTSSNNASNANTSGSSSSSSSSTFGNNASALAPLNPIGNNANPLAPSASPPQSTGITVPQSSGRGFGNQQNSGASGLKSFGENLSQTFCPEEVRSQGFSQSDNGGTTTNNNNNTNTATIPTFESLLASAPWNLPDRPCHPETEKIIHNFLTKRKQIAERQMIREREILQDMERQRELQMAMEEGLAMGAAMQQQTEGISAGLGMNPADNMMDSGRKMIDSGGANMMEVEMSDNNNNAASSSGGVGSGGDNNSANNSGAKLNATPLVTSELRRGQRLSCTGTERISPESGGTLRQSLGGTERMTLSNQTQRMSLGISGEKQFASNAMSSGIMSSGLNSGISGMRPRRNSDLEKLEINGPKTGNPLGSQSSIQLANAGLGNGFGPAQSGLVGDQNNQNTDQNMNSNRFSFGIIDQPSHQKVKPMRLSFGISMGFGANTPGPQSFSNRNNSSSDSSNSNNNGGPQNLNTNANTNANPNANSMNQDTNVNGTNANQIQNNSNQIQNASNQIQSKPSNNTNTTNNTTNNTTTTTSYNFTRIDASESWLAYIITNYLNVEDQLTMRQVCREYSFLPVNQAALKSMLFKKICKFVDLGATTAPVVGTGQIALAGGVITLPSTADAGGKTAGAKTIGGKKTAGGKKNPGSKKVMLGGFGGLGGSMASGGLLGNMNRGGSFRTNFNAGKGKDAFGNLEGWFYTRKSGSTAER